MQLSHQMMQPIIQRLREQCDAELILLIGSAARGELRVDSDVDLVYMSSPHRRPLSTYRRYMLAQELADLLGRDVDLIDFACASTVFQLQIATTAVVLYEQNELLRPLAWITAYRDYALLGERRQTVVDTLLSPQSQSMMTDAAKKSSFILPIEYHTDRLSEQRNKDTPVAAGEYSATSIGGTLIVNRDIILNKSATIRRCVQRIHEEYEGNVDNLFNFTRQDSIILNLQRACEGCLDLAMHLISENKLGVPQSSRDAFDLLQRSGIIDPALNRSLKAMVGFRNIAMHDYQAVQVEILEEMIEEQLPDFEQFIICVEQSG